jgi:hypothetical protein
LIPPEAFRPKRASKAWSLLGSWLFAMQEVCSKSLARTASRDPFGATLFFH